MRVIEYALQYLGAGLSIFPVRCDGTKAPQADLLPLVHDDAHGGDKPSWKPYQTGLPDEDTVRGWWDNQKPPGIACVCGAVSAGLEVIDFDRNAGELFPLWCQMVEEAVPGLLERLTVNQTPRDPTARHVWLRCGDIETPGNQKLAMLPASSEEDARKRVLIETRGEGGYALVPGCPLECHETHRPYLHVSGPPLWKLHHISMDERDILLACARYFDRSEVVSEPIPRSKPGSDLRPGDDYDQNGDSWEAILQPHGWVLAGTFCNEKRWRRPGKAAGWSATTGHCQGKDGADLLRVFSGNADPFEEGKAYGKFRAWALLNNRGDLVAAAKALRGLGYGGAARRYPRPKEPQAPRPSALRSPLPAYRPFPIDTLARPLARLVEESSIALGCDPSYVALPALAACSAAIGNSRSIRLKRTWEEPSVLWAVVVGDSGTLKTPAFKMAMRPLYKIQKEMRERYRLELVRHEDQLEAWRESCRKAKSAGSEPPSEPRKPTMRRAVCSDITIECLAEKLEDNPRGVLLACEELRRWLGSFMRYKSGGGSSDLPAWLELYQAGTLTYDRKTGDRKMVFVEHASVSVTGGIQPGALARALTSEHFDAGMVARLLLAMPPRRTKVWTEAEVSRETEEGYKLLLERLMALNMRSTRDSQEPHRLLLQPTAKEAWVRFYTQWARVQADVEGELAACYSKIEGVAARLALIHHVVTMLDLECDDQRDVMEPSIEAGVKLARWFADEAARVYRVLTESEEDRSTRRLLEWIGGRGGTVAPRKLQRSNATRFPTTEAAQAALEALVSAGLGTWQESLSTDKGGRPSRTFHINPTPDKTDTTDDKEFFDSPDTTLVENGDTQF